MLGNSPISLIFRQKSQCTLLREMVRSITFKSDSGYLGVNPNVDRSMGLFLLPFEEAIAMQEVGIYLFSAAFRHFIYGRLQCPAPFCLGSSLTLLLLCVPKVHLHDWEAGFVCSLLLPSFFFALQKRPVLFGQTLFYMNCIYNFCTLMKIK